MIAELTAAAGIELAETGWLPDAVVRRGMRRLCRRRLRDVPRLTPQELARRVDSFADDCRRQPVAPVPEKANEQHYEVPAEFFRYVLGPRRKYSSCYWPADCATLAEAEEHALRITAERAGVEDGMRVLELGCGWGSLTLWLAEKFPRLRVTAVSNSHGQREYIEQQVRERGWQGRVNIITADMNDFQAPGPFDRVVSVEMFEHMRNYQQLFRRIASWLTPQGKLFVHVFCHRQLAYPFDTDGAANWMGRYFFTGGIMPSADLFSRFADDLRVARQWTWNGQHYARTAEAWVQNMDAHRSAIMPILSQTYGSAQAARWFRRWRMLFLAGAELFGYANGEEWRVDHYLLERAQVNGDAT